jgi:geranylgeranyl diphosphate synthase, type I
MKPQTTDLDSRAETLQSGPRPVDGAGDAAQIRRRAGTTGSESPAVLERVRVLVDPVLRAGVSRLHPDSALIVGYHCGWNDAGGDVTGSVRGRGVCPALAVLSTQVCGASAQTALPGAAAVELVHVFTHLHDDIMDGDERRRERASAWTVFGSGPTILAGDAVFTAAVQAVAAAPGAQALRATRRVLDMSARVGFGQAQDLDFERLPFRGPGSVDVSGYLGMAGGKTGAIYEASLAIGAELAGAREDVVAALASAGHALGLVAQIVDDLNGIWGDPQVTGKPVGGDLRRRKKTLPVVAAVTADCRAGFLLAELLSRPPNPTDDPELLGHLVIDAGGLDFAIEEADRQLHSALDDLTGVAMPAVTREELLGVAAFIRHRHA